MTQNASLKIGTRGSPLALTQAIETRSLLMAAHGLPEEAFEIVVIKTTADRIQDRALRDVGGKGLFTREIENALLDGTIDMAVHCVKDVPVERPEGLALGCHLVREDPRDAFVSSRWESLWDLPEGAVVGTSSVRRRAQLLHRRPDLAIVDFRGNVETRLKKLEDGVAVATLLAVAGLNRLHMSGAVGRPIDTADMLPAVGQGALMIERRADDAHVAELLAPLDDAATGCQMAAERAFLAVLDGSCQTPIAGLSEIIGNRIHLRGEILRLDGSEVISASGEADVADAAELGRRLARQLLDQAPSDFLVKTL
ncbi:hydroxymethylbilane synthase [Shinella sp.]|uniref:hydroxymethylbilane synthase n=1 Tax=Shinella sp. TaxID=1870904 RepID=UPI002587E14E|nr:hydroxymethylbilane synthase [Shinella sp.]MCW5709271.1 hydroxymethylbilane synthase [Shinella sp.]